MIPNEKDGVILFVSDDAQWLTDLCHAFSEQTDYQLSCMASEMGLPEQVSKCQPDVCLLDASQYSSDLLSLIAQVRAQSSLGIIVLLANHEQSFSAELLAHGADVVFDKAVRVPLLSVAVERLYIRVAQLNALQSLIDQAAPSWELDQLTLCLKSPDKEVISLSAIEFKLLIKLHEHFGQPVSRYDLACFLGRERCENYESYINTLMSRLRRKIREHTEYTFEVKACRGAGYRLGTQMRVGAVETA